MIYEFGSFELDSRKRLLTSAGELRHLPPKVFETLLYLVENRARIISKNELMEKIWHNRFVEEGNLTQKIFFIRKVLGERKNTHQFLATVPGEGYIFVAPVAEKDPDSGAVSENTRREYPANQIAKKSLEKKWLAVLPFVEINRRKIVKNSFRRAGFAEALIETLSNYKDINIRANLSILKYVNEAYDIETAGKELKADFLVNGSVQYSGENVKISVQLTKVSEEKIIWAESRDFKSKDILKVPKPVAEEFAGAIALKLKADARTQNYGETDSPEAFKLFIRGRYFWNTRKVEGLKKAIQFAGEALALDPAYASAYVGLADSYILLAGQHTHFAPKNAFPKSKAFARRALEICPELGPAHASLGFTAFWFDRDWKSAEGYFQEAIKYSPNYPTSYHWYGEALAAKGDFNKALHFLNRALELDPLSSAITADIAQTYFWMRQYDESEKYLEQIFEIAQDYVRGWVLKGLICQQTNRPEEAAFSFETAANLSPTDLNILAELGYFYALSGKKDIAAEILSQLLQNQKQQFVSPLNIAMIYFGLGDKSSAIAWLKKAFAENDIWLGWVDVDPKFDSYKDTFRKLKAAAGSIKSII